MSSITERTLGSRIANADALATHLTTFAAYAPIRPEDSVVNYKAHITSTKAANTLVATNQTIYSNAVENRVKLFSKNPDSLAKVLGLIASYVRSKFGKTSKEADDVAKLISKIRGTRNAKLKKNEEGEFVSQSQVSYGSRTMKFADIIAKLAQFGTDYAPTNVKVKLLALNAQLAGLTTANNAVASAYGLLKPSKDVRASLYLDLKDRSGRIKESVKSQFGIKASEYKLIKGLGI